MEFVQVCSIYYPKNFNYWTGKPTERRKVPKVTENYCLGVALISSKIKITKKNLVIISPMFIQLFCIRCVLYKYAMAFYCMVYRLCITEVWTVCWLWFGVCVLNTDMPDGIHSLHNNLMYQIFSYQIFLN